MEAVEAKGPDRGPVKELSYGQKAVGITFNPGGMPEVNSIKEKCAEVIDLLWDQSQATNNGEKKAQLMLAIRKIQEGQLWGVKAVTWQY